MKDATRDRRTARGHEVSRHVRQGRLVAIVLVATMAIWLALQALGGALGWPARWVFLFDLAALAAFGWALIVTAALWRGRKDGKGERDAR